MGGSKGGAAGVEFICGDFTVFDWSDGKDRRRGPNVCVCGGCSLFVSLTSVMVSCEKQSYNRIL